MCDSVCAQRPNNVAFAVDCGVTSLFTNFHFLSLVLSRRRQTACRRQRPSPAVWRHAAPLRLVAWNSCVFPAPAASAAVASLAVRRIARIISAGAAAFTAVGRSVWSGVRRRSGQRDVLPIGPGASKRASERSALRRRRGRSAVRRASAAVCYGSSRGSH